jgi:uncharacterized membrane protein
MQEGGMIMATLADTILPLADTWTMHDGWGWMMPMMFGMALFWGAIILGFVWLVRDGFVRREGHEDTALTILDHRFAEGALSADEYHQRRNTLTGGGGATA